MKKYVPIMIGILIGWLITITSCVNPLKADNNEINTYGKYSVSVTGTGDVLCVIINTETGEIFKKVHISAYDFSVE